MHDWNTRALPLTVATILLHENTKILAQNLHQNTGYCTNTLYTRTLAPSRAVDLVVGTAGSNAAAALEKMHRK